MLNKEALEKHEENWLGSCAVRSGQSEGRKFEEPTSPFRTVFQRDRDRIIHSAAFRRLEYKTQVFVNHEGDHYRTRLTHTMEAAQIGRTIARALQLNEDLTEAVILAHDLGHTPFGHAGERAMDDLMREQGGFEHNVQSLRVVDILEVRYPQFRGLNLTFEVREGIARHSTPYDRPSGIPEFQTGVLPPLESQIADLADEIAYNNHDLDDGLASQLLSWDGLQEVRLFQETSSQVADEHPGKRVQELKNSIISVMISKFVNDVIENTNQQLQKHQIDSLERVRNHPTRLVSFSAEMEEKKNQLKDYLMENMYLHWRVIRMEEKAKRILGDLFAAYMKREGQIPKEYLEKCESGIPIEKVVCDYLAGMTDRFALDEHKKLFDPHERV